LSQKIPFLTNIYEHFTKWFQNINNKLSTKKEETENLKRKNPTKKPPLKEWLYINKKRLFNLTY